MRKEIYVSSNQIQQIGTLHINYQEYFQIIKGSAYPLFLQSLTYIKKTIDRSKDIIH